MIHIFKNITTQHYGQKHYWLVSQAQPHQFKCCPIYSINCHILQRNNSFINYENLAIKLNKNKKISLPRYNWNFFRSEKLHIDFLWPKCTCTKEFEKINNFLFYKVKWNLLKKMSEWILTWNRSSNSSVLTDSASLV